MNNWNHKIVLFVGIIAAILIIGCATFIFFRHTPKYREEAGNDYIEEMSANINVEGLTSKATENSVEKEYDEKYAKKIALDFINTKIAPKLNRIFENARIVDVYRGTEYITLCIDLESKLRGEGDRTISRVVYVLVDKDGNYTTTDVRPEY